MHKNTLFSKNRPISPSNPLKNRLISPDYPSITAPKTKEKEEKSKNIQEKARFMQAARRAEKV
ncbi:hypothetical protein [Acutalibacter caecimuris]|uniref:hypothetical protein n=1 Tax=Acutalibacter caecimuris TaxID=3093657 RepID=UPI002AC9A1C2|nr:hypothetical protein [Acutalibacter sp. M00118]